MHELLRLLETEEIPATRLTVDTLVHGGRRKQRRRRLIAAVTVIALLPLWLGVGTAPIELIAPGFHRFCVGSLLPVPAGHEEGVAVQDADPTGRYIVGLAGGKVVGWHGGTMSVMDPPVEPVSMVVNSAGVVAAAGWDGAWVLKDGIFTRLAAPEGKPERLSVDGITSRGDIAGNWSGGPVVWRADDLTPTTLPKPEDSEIVSATAIDDDGTIVGTGGSGNYQTALVWPGDGTVRPLPVPGQIPRAVRNGRAISIFDEPILWDLRTDEVIKLSDRLTRAFDINRAGLVAGVGLDGMPVIIDPAGDRTLRLPVTPAPPGTVWPWSVSHLVISDDGSLIAGTIRVGQRDNPVRWTCW